MTGHDLFAASRDGRGRAARSAHTVPPASALYLKMAVLPAAMIAAVCAVLAAAVLFGGGPAHTVRMVLAVVTGGVAAMLVVAVVAARATDRQVAAQARAVRLAAQRCPAELQQLVESVLRGEQPAPLASAPPRAAGGGPFGQLMTEIEQAHYHAGQSVLRIAGKVFGSRADQRVEIFVNLARRMQSLVHREIELLDELEGKVEDPDLLKGLFTVDHLATRMRRQSESLAVLGGSTSRRQWNRQVTMHEVLRAAVAEVEQYSRVKVVPPVEGVLRGGAVTDVIHLIAELVENATKFSAPHTIAVLRAQHVAAGVAIEIEDRGLGIFPADQQRMNDLLADPGRLDVDELLRDGRIGLYVVAMLARRHGIRVQLQNNIYGGTQAVVVLPLNLLEQADRGRGLPRAEPAEQADGPRLALAPLGASAPAGGSAGYGHDFGRPSSGASAVPGAPATPVTPAVPATPVAPAVPATAASPATRPPLPKRQLRGSFAAQQFDNHRDELSGASAARSTEPPADQMTGLMADFLRGVSRAEEEDSPTRD